MAYRRIQWSCGAHFGAGYGHTRDEKGEPVMAAMGYIDQAFRIGFSPMEYADEDLVKAANILNQHAPGMAEALHRHLAARREGSHAEE